jgi:carbamoyl-phosphate synthase large subunit
MKSTGEVMGIDKDFATAFAKSQIGAGSILPDGGKLFVSVKDSDKPVIVPAVRQLRDLGFTICATGGTADYLTAQGIEIERVNKVAQGRPHIVDKVKDGEIALIFTTTEGWQSLKDSEDIRRSALANKVPQYTTAAGGVAAARAIAAMRTQKLEVRTLQDYHRTNTG